MEYRVSDYGSMIADKVRMDAYARALDATVGPGSVVLDLGTGTGMIALLAAQLGARRVYGVEPGDVIQLARDVVSRNGLHDRVELIQALSTAIELPEPVDVIVSDLRGVLPLHKAHIPSLVDARQRLLKREGTLIPLRDTLWTALVEAPETYRKEVECWSVDGRGFDFTSAQEIVTNTWWRERIQASQLLTGAGHLAVLDYTTIVDANMSSAVSLTASRPGIAHGLCVWFDAELVEGVTFSNAPGQPDTIYGQAFFPLASPVEVERGDVADILVGGTLLAGDYVWRWEMTATRQDLTTARLRQSTALGVPLSRDLLRRSSESYVAELNADGDVLRTALGLMDGRRSSAEVAVALVQRYPDRFEAREDPLGYVIELSQKYRR